MDKNAKRARIAAYKERKAVAGVFAVRCAPTGQVWVGATPTLDTIQTQLWFGLRLRSAPQHDVQAAWNEHGETAFSFERLDAYDEETADLTLEAWLKDRAADWRARLGARRA